MTARFLNTCLTSMLVLASCGTPQDVDVVDTDPGPDALCTELGLMVEPFRTDEVGPELGDVAGDFSFTEGEEAWVFSEQFTGCSSYVFLVNFPGVSDDWTQERLDDLVTMSPDNVEYFFLSDSDDKAVRTAFLDGMEAALDDALRANIARKAKREAFAQRVHFVQKRASKVEGSIGEFITNLQIRRADPSTLADLGDRGMAPIPLPEAFGIDRAQRFDAGGSLSPYVGSPADDPAIVTWLPRFYNYRYDLDARLDDTSDVTVVPVLAELTTGRVFTLEAALPASGTMATFDTLEFDVTIDCLYDNPFSCSEWDRTASIYWCEDGEACAVKREVARWITPYWRRGRQRYALEASPMLGLLQDGGSQYFHIALGPSWERATEWYAAVSLRMSDQGGPRPLAAVPAFTGGNFGAGYNDREPVPFTPPAGTTKAEVVVLVTGHGQQDGNRCAEWCDHRHTFSVDGSDLETIAHVGEIGDGTGCAERADAGVIPGQWGNWAQSRAFWCPGMGVTPERRDITEMVSTGSESAVDYRGSFGVTDPSGGTISLASYVVFYADP